MTKLNQLLPCRYIINTCMIKVELRDDRKWGGRGVWKARGWQMPAFPCKELDLILNEMEQDLIYILKGLL